ncbi:LLM class flavin-dependent oxidoreductase [Lapillicoccus jejuensis]|uniref:Alkanesulfonate monooxygenase SsuD/methylene tetrahydromethanopterin reductase-like flavin-dependent oxidoreductase (Luciferase family) n=1 Tax=Lapillicoccus jejuensis TaxID=402171 RepID=A0A542E4V1_9MICO|nr:LLM class flavin-dependent oxidoreductase [Lapillicoccus jejuensis]TQJ10355.1 alkanesulfonate monooxygenase SsuD/methylene tetrahydromethanopterin reductase-like flavin-dependent oxidoreductase (luciferase family) [Lapillicoccus jejuensis]
MDISFWPTAKHPWTVLRDLSLHAEEVGVHGVWVMDHFMDNTEQGGGDVHEGFTLLAALAAVVPRVRLGTLVAGNTYRHPAVVANQARTIDHVSDGRFVLGLGAGWQVNEHEQYGIELPAVGPRLRRFEEACRVVRALRDEPVADLDGRYYRLTAARMDPKPVGPLPLMIGGAGEKVMAGIVARQADEWNVWGDPDLFAHKSGVMTAACEREGRDPASLRRTVQARIVLDGVTEAIDLDDRTVGGSLEQLRDTLGRYRDAGADEFIVLDGHLGGDAERSRALLDAVVHDVAPALG